MGYFLSLSRCFISILKETCVLPDLSAQSNLRVLRIGNGVEANDLLRSLPYLSNLEELQISTFPLEPEELIGIGTSHCLNQNIKKLDMSMAFNSSVGDFLEMIDTSSRMNHLSLSFTWVPINHSSFQTLCGFIEKTNRLPSLTVYFNDALFPNDAAQSLYETMAQIKSLLHFGIKNRSFEKFEDSSGFHSLSKHLSLKPGYFGCGSLEMEMLKQVAYEHRIDACQLVRRCRLLSSCRFKPDVPIVFPFELLEKIFNDSLQKSDSWDPKKYRLIQHCLLSRKTIGKISLYFDFSAESLYWACKRAEEMI